MTHNPDSLEEEPKSLAEWRYIRALVVGIRGPVLAALNQVDAVLSEVDSKIQVAKNRIEQPATRCRFCSVKIMFRRTDKGVKAFELDGITLHQCWKKHGGPKA